MKKLFEKIDRKWDEQSDSIKILIVIGLISIIGIILRWNQIILSLSKAFARYKGYAD